MMTNHREIHAVPHLADLIQYALILMAHPNAHVSQIIADPHPIVGLNVDLTTIVQII